MSYLVLCFPFCLLMNSIRSNSWLFVDVAYQSLHAKKAWASSCTGSSVKKVTNCITYTNKHFVNNII